MALSELKGPTFRTFLVSAMKIKKYSYASKRYNCHCIRNFYTQPIELHDSLRLQNMCVINNKIDRRLHSDSGSLRARTIVLVRVRTLRARTTNSNFKYTRTGTAVANGTSNVYEYSSTDLQCTSILVNTSTSNARVQKYCKLGTNRILSGCTKCPSFFDRFVPGS